MQRYWKRTYPAQALRARRRVETPPGAQAQVDWAHFGGVQLGPEPVDLVAFHMVLSWLPCHTAAFRRQGGVPATVRAGCGRRGSARGDVANSRASRHSSILTAPRALVRFGLGRFPCPPCSRPWLPPGRERIVPVRIALSDAAVAAVHEELCALVAGDLTPRVDGLPLGLVNGRRTLATGTAHGPPILMRDNMLVALPHCILLIGNPLVRH